MKSKEVTSVAADKQLLHLELELAELFPPIDVDVPAHKRIERVRRELVRLLQECRQVDERTYPELHNITQRFIAHIRLSAAVREVPPPI